MLVKILGTFDIFVAAVLFLAAVSVSISTKLFIILAIVLAIKSVPNLNLLCAGSIIDAVIIAVLIIGIFTPVNAAVLFVAAFAIAQKGVMSFI